MKGLELLDAIENLDPAYIEAAAAIPKVLKAARLKKWGAAAACFILLLSVGFGTYAYAAEVREYHAAIKFFNEYALSTEGLTRGEIKKIYRDITTESFSYSKTAEVIMSSLSADQIEGFDIIQQNTMPEAVENLWDCLNHTSTEVPFLVQEGIRYEYHCEYTDDHLYYFERSCLEKYDGETLMWSASVAEFMISDYVEVFDGVIAYGETHWISTDQTRSAWMAKFDHDGKLVWKHQMDHGFKNEYISAILENEDGSCAVISRGDLKYFCFSLYSADGKETHFQKTEVGNYGIWNTVRFDDGYIVQLGSYMPDESARIVNVDSKGNITEFFSYGSEDVCYYITDIIEFDGKIYLSAYAVAKPDYAAADSGRRYEIDGVLDYLFDNELWDISSEELTAMVRDIYTAMLLVCERDGGMPQKFYSVKGSLGATLSLNDSGNLLWDVESISTTFFSPMTSSFTIGGSCRIFRYTFDPCGVLISQEMTDESAEYRR